jgi:hypothetical protein
MAVRPTLRRGTRLALGFLLLGSGVLGVTATGTSAAPTTATPAWAPAATATIHPGILTETRDGQCTANFLFTDARGTAYLGQAAHCSATGSPTETDGCQAASLPLGTKVVLGNSGLTGTLAYNSWITMQHRRESDANACIHNDFALVRLPVSARRVTNPSIPFWGGPVGLDTDGTQPAEVVLSYGNSPLYGGVAELSPKRGESLGTTAGGWSHPVWTVPAGVPGDSGSAFVDGAGRAIGTLSTLTLAPVPLTNGVGDLARQLRYAQLYSGIPGLRLVLGTEPFSGAPLP